MIVWLANLLRVDQARQFFKYVKTACKPVSGMLYFIGMLLAYLWEAKFHGHPYHTRNIRRNTPWQKK